jgi:predicted TIM-barrel fold metal-dependent hydrolase
VGALFPSWRSMLILFRSSDVVPHQKNTKKLDLFDTQKVPEAQYAKYKFLFWRVKTKIKEDYLKICENNIKHVYNLR